MSYTLEEGIRYDDSENDDEDAAPPMSPASPGTPAPPASPKGGPVTYEEATAFARMRPPERDSPDDEGGCLLVDMWSSP